MPALSDILLEIRKVYIRYSGTPGSRRKCAIFVSASSKGTNVAK